jgi:hypothetical protein
MGFLAPLDEPLGEPVPQMTDPNLELRREIREPPLVGLQLMVMRKGPAFAKLIQEHVHGVLAEL